MNKIQLIAYPAIAAMLFGCAAMTERDKTVERLNTEVTQLKRSTDDMNARLDELNNKFNLLSDKVESVSDKVSSSVAAPEGLKVVKLGEGGETRPAQTRNPAQPPQEAKQARQASAEVKESPAQTPPATASPAPAPAQALSQPALGEDALYGRAIELIHSGRYNDARASLNDFLRAYPSSHLAGNAFYWIGETYYTDKDFNTAIEKFSVVPERYPSSNKAPDALLKVGYSYLELHENDKARETLQTLVRRYPESEAAGKAKKTLGNVSAAPSKKRK